MRTPKITRRMRPMRSFPPFRTLLLIEQLEARIQPDNGAWVAVFNGIAPAASLSDQTRIGQNLLHAAGLQDQNVAVVQALDLSGSFALQTPVNVTDTELEQELKPVPGFSFVFDLEKSGADGQVEEDGGDLINQDYYQATYGPFDYTNFLSREKNGEFPGQGGSVDPTPNDIRTNNNVGAGAAANFTQSETTLVAFGNTVVVGFNDSGSNAGGSNKFTGFSRSTDGGNTFVDGGTLPTNAGGDAGDPAMARSDSTGRIFFATLGFSVATIQVFHSDDNGVSWSAPVNGTPGGASEDKEWITVDNFAGAGQGNVYLVSRNFGGGNGVRFYRSTDNGNTFGPTGGTLIVSGSQGAFVAVGPDHSVYAFWFAGTTIQMRKSTDQGLTFGAPVTVASGLVGGTNGDLGLTGIRQGTSTAAGFRSNEFPHAVVNPVSGNIYVTYNNDAPGVDKGDVFFVQSTNGGVSFSAPLRVNDDVTTTDQWQPTLAVTPGGDKLGIFYYSRQEDPAGNNLFKYYGRIAVITGPTLTFAPSFAVSDTASLPEFGRDGVVNSVYMGDYNTAVATPGAFHVVWSDNRFDLTIGPPRKDPDVFYKKIALGLAVTTTVPAAGSVVFTQPTSFTVNTTDPVLAGTIDASDFTVNGIAATSFAYTAGTTTIVFTYASSPVTAQGLQTMHVDAGAFTRDPDGNPVAQYDATFRYDVTLLQVVSTIPPFPGGTFTLPGPFTYDVNFNEAVDPASVQTSDLGLSGIGGAIATGVTVLAGNTTARFTIGGVTSEGTLTASIGAGAITDAFGNPGAAFTAAYQVDIGTVPYPTPLSPKNPRGSLIYDPSAAGVINFVGDIDSFTLGVDPGQTISVLLTPTSPGLQASLELRDPSSALIASGTAGAAGQNVILQTVATTTGGTYTFSVGGAGGTTGGYALTVTLNAALENEGLLPGVNNNTLATAQNIDGSFETLQTSLASAQRGAVTGTSDNAGYAASAVAFTFTEITATGTHVLPNTDDSAVTISIPFAFSFFGTNFTSVGFSSNGLITFGGTDASFTNADLTTSPALAGIAPFWDDLFTGPNGIAWQVIGSPGSRQLIIEWDNARFFAGGSNTLKLEAVLSEGSNNIQFNYLNLSNGGSGSEGSSATVGLKAAGTQGPNRLLLAFNNGPNAFVGTGKSTLITPPNPTPDLYSFTLTAGQTTTLAATSLPSGNLTVQLLDSGGGVLATGVGGSTNVTSVIGSFTAATAGTYYARVTGASNTNYSLVVTRNAAFDTESNDAAGSAQDLTGRGGALGAVVGGTVYQASAVTFAFEDIRTTGAIITGLDGADDSSVSIPIGFAFPFFNSSNTTVFVSSNGLLTFGGGDATFTNADLTTSPALAGIAPFWDDMFIIPAPNAHVLFQVLGSGSNQHLVIQWDRISFFSGGTSGDTLTFQAALYADGRIQFNYQDLVSGSATGNNGGSATVGIKDAGTQGPNRLLLAFNNGPNTFVGTGKSTLISKPPSDDWYKVTLSGDQTAIQLETRTPADGPNEFVNTFDPHIQLYNAANVLIATGAPLADGRNESILATGLATGTYFAKVSADNSTAGEYFLGSRALRTPTLPITVDDKSWSFQVFGPGWSTTNGIGYNGSVRTHAGGGTGANFAQWQYSQNVVAGNQYEVFATWVANPANATNASYKIYDGATLLTTVTVDQTRSPNTGLFGTTLIQKLYTYMPATTGFHVIRVQLSDNANGTVVADAVFDPPIGGFMAMLPAGRSYIPLAPIFVEPLRPVLGAAMDATAGLAPVPGRSVSTWAQDVAGRSARSDTASAVWLQPAVAERSRALLEDDEDSLVAAGLAPRKPAADDGATSFLDDGWFIEGAEE